MAKQGMKRPNDNSDSKNKHTPMVPEIRGKAKMKKQKAAPIIAGTKSPSLKVFHTVPFEEEEPIPPVYRALDNDLARDNLENDLTAADIQDL